MGWKGTLRSVQAAVRAAERDSRRRQRVLERRRQAISKANEIERAAYEVEVYRNRLEQLVSVHQEGGSRIDWQNIALIPPPPPPEKITAQERSARLRLESYKPNIVTRILRRVEKVRSRLEHDIELGRRADEAAFRQAGSQYDQQNSEWKEQKDLAERILGGDLAAYLDVIKEVNPFREICDLGSGVEFEISNAQSITADISVHGEIAVPRESKSLLKSGKLSVKQAPKGEFYRLYQDYICSCVLRVARELFALLPLETVIASAVDMLVNSSTGHLEKQPILSVVIPRRTFESLNLDLIDPSDSMKNFVHRMDFRATTGFRPVERLSPGGLPHAS
jgi:hypothetical protein